MEKTNHPVDDIFSKGLSEFQVAPLADTKKKIFASPAAIKPIKPWYIASKNIILVSSALLVSSFLLYYFFFDNSTRNIINDNQSNITANTITKNATTTSDQLNNNAPINLSQPENKTDASILRQAQDFSITNPLNKTTNNVEKISNTNTSVNLSSLPRTNREEDKENGSSENTSDKKLTAITEPLNTTNISDINNNLSNNNTSKPIISNADFTSIKNYDVNISSNASIEINSSANNNLVTQNHENKYFSFMIKRTIPYFSNGISSEFLFTKKESDYHLKGLWFIEAKAGIIVSNYNVKGKDEEWDNAAKAKQDLLATAFGYEALLNAVYQKNNWLIKGGLSYANYGEKLKGKVLLTDPYNETNISFNGGPYDIMIGGNYYLIDTIGSYYHYTYTQTNHIFISDSVLAWKTQNVLADVWDTTQVTLFDSLPKTAINNNIRYFEIPLSVGYVIPYGRFTIGLNATIAPGYFINVKGSNMNAEQYPALEPYKKSTITKFTLSAGTELEFGYQINEGLMLSFSPFYRKSLLPMYNAEYQLKQSASHYGFRVGIRKLL